jgi:hypothetical protein
VKGITNCIGQRVRQAQEIAGKRKQERMKIRINRMNLMMMIDDDDRFSEDEFLIIPIDARQRRIVSQTTNPNTEFFKQTSK